PAAGACPRHASAGRDLLLLAGREPGPPRRLRQLLRAAARPRDRRIDRDDLAAAGALRAPGAASARRRDGSGRDAWRSGAYFPARLSRRPLYDGGALAADDAG